MVDTYQRFRDMFPNVDLELTDLFLLEWFQISYLPGWIPEREFAALLYARPDVERYLLIRYPPIHAYFER